MIGMEKPRMNATVKKWAKNIIRWGIAVAGIYYVVSNISLYDRVMKGGAGGWPVSLRLAQPTSQDAAVHCDELLAMPRERQGLSLL